jgi:hypothetical protein
MNKKTLLNVIAFSSLGLFATNSVLAQVNPLKESIATNLGGTRFVITAPTSISGVKKINYATWGATATPTITNRIIEKAYDTLGAATLLNGTGPYPSLTGKFALIYRGGGFTFSQKVNYCIAAGASGVIIVNNVPGDPVGMGATPAGSTVAVPVLMVSDIDGQAISDAIKTSAPNTVRMTLGTWNTGGTHDLGVMTAYQAGPHALNIPLHQLTGSAGTEAYKHYIGGAVANYGSMNETGITVTDSVFWTPKAGTAAYVTKNSYTVSSVSVADSIRFGFGTGTYELTPPTTTGKYEHKYSTAYGFADDFPQDNKTVITQNVTDSIFCKGSYDFVNARPNTSLGIRPGTATPSTFVMGNLFYVKNGGYAARKVQFSLSHQTEPTLVTAVSVSANIFKWVDGVGGDKDSIMQSGELTGVGTAAKIFTTLDSSGRTLTLQFLDFNDPLKPVNVIVQDNSWYYVAVEVPAPLFIGVDEGLSFFTRGYAQWRNAGSIPGKLVNETATGLAVSDNSTFFGNPLNDAAPYPFSGNAYYIDSAFYDRFNEISSVALLMSSYKPTLSINNLASANNFGSSSVYPNPATKGSITVDVALAQKSKNVVYRITDVLGKTIYSELHNDVQNEKFEINTANFASGNYYLMIITDNALDNKKITIQN